ncbi:hypothetical protein ACROSR_06490 [Roseovarius tibetensis]|uniref:hypothetical protein n=1 Tax=Roseovarius tibetensis TaxID=2685897 RepID=UPI003D7F5C66
MTDVARHSPVPVACLAAFVILAGCAREDEAAQRARLAQWFSLGETISFTARRDCAVGLYEVVAPDVKSALPLMPDVVQMQRMIDAQGAAALDVTAQGADVAMVAMANHARPTGMAMRRAGLEARACMDKRSEGAFRHALDHPGGIMAWDADTGTLILMARDADVLVAVQGNA